MTKLCNMIRITQLHKSSQQKSLVQSECLNQEVVFDYNHNVSTLIKVIWNEILVAVFVNKIIIWPPKVWKKFWPLLHRKLKKIIWPELSKQCYNLSCTMCRMNFLSNILTWLTLQGNLRIKLFAYILLWNKECVLSFTFLSLRPNKF